LPRCTSDICLAEISLVGFNGLAAAAHRGKAPSRIHSRMRCAMNHADR
jgi:hypothetical protein